MLYISRQVGKNTWGVTDTDDGIENLCSLSDLMAAVRTCHLDIKGVTLSHGSLNVEVYQNPEYLTKKQAKSVTLFGVDVKTSGNSIVGLQIKRGLCKGSVTVRLSDYGTSCGNYILSDLQARNCPGHVYIVVDDKLKLSKKTFTGLREYGNVYLDLSEVTNQKTLDSCYMCDDFRDGPESVSAHIRDDSDRLDFYAGIAILIQGLGKFISINKASDVVSPVDAVSKKLAERYRKEWDTLANFDFQRETKHPWMSGYFGHSKQSIGLVAQAYYEDSLSYKLAKQAMSDIFFVLRQTSNIPQAPLGRMQNYFIYFNPTREAQDILVELCGRGATWVVSLSEGE